MNQTSTQSPTTSRRPWSVLILVAVAQFMVVLDMTIVNVALPSIDAELGFAGGDLQWVVTAYLLFTGGLLLLGGRASDLLGRRRVFLTGLLIFTGASLAGGLAWSPAALIVARAAQGLGAALLTPAALSIITTTYTGAQRTTALSAWGAIGSAGAAAGVLFGGILTTWLSWEWVFLVNVPVGLAAIVLTPRFVSATSPIPVGRGQLDLAGAASVVAGLGALVYALEGANEHGWGSVQTLVLLALAGVLLATFATVERVTASPLVPPHTWGIRSLVSAGVVMLGVTGILVGSFFLNSLYLQNVLGASALETGLGFLPLVVAIGLAVHVASHLLPGVGARAVIVAGFVLVAAGALVLVAAPDRASYATHLLPGFLLIGAGVGLVFPAVSVTAMSEVRADEAGLASGLITTAHEIGAALGVAVLAAIVGANGGGALHAGNFVAGYADGFLTAAGVATALAFFALLVIPAARPAAHARMAVH